MEWMKSQNIRVAGCSSIVVQLGFRTQSPAQEYLNYFISYYKWVKSGSTGIPCPLPIGGNVGGIGTGTGGTGCISAGTGGAKTARTLY